MSVKLRRSSRELFGFGGGIASRDYLILVDFGVKSEMYLNGCGGGRMF